ncbi:MAG TPA: HEAT repeat domain-containing protein [Candidatus Limnocylindrales bacterium]|nr:HEAT repeat domain-containing protein [Candidatus Limnocylindrales bacterium]
MVRNAAARRLGRFRQPHVVDALLSSLGRDHLIGAGEALAQLAEPRAIPHLVECLEDDYKKEKAMEALRRFGPAAVPFLCEAVRQPRFVLGVEPPVSVERRCRAAQLLGELNAKEAEFALDAGLREENVETRIASAIALAQLGVLAREVVSQLVAGLDDPDLIVRKSCQEALQKAGAKAISLLADAANGQVIHLGPQNEVCLTLNARLVAIKILGSIPHVSAIYCLVNQLKDPHEIIRYRTVVALEKFNDRKVRAALEHVVRNDLSRRVKMRAREALQFVLEQNHLSGADKLSS